MATETVANSELANDLREYADTLIENGYTLYYLPDGEGQVNWFIFGKADKTGKVNVGTLDLGYHGGISIIASLVPNAKWGSGAIVYDTRPETPTHAYKNWLDAAAEAVQPMVTGLWTPPLPNHGIRHFDWCADRLVNLRASR